MDAMEKRFVKEQKFISDIQQENERLKKLEYKFLDNSGDEESFTLEEYLDMGNKLYDVEKENTELKAKLSSIEELFNKKEDE